MGVADRFEVVVTSVEHGLRKPLPTIFEHALERLDSSPERCVYVGDNPVADYGGALGAGMRALLIDPDDAAGVPGHDRLDSILELERRLAARLDGAM
jgi:putative hydrolase of the HAD superfamily